MCYQIKQRKISSECNRYNIKPSEINSLLAITELKLQMKQRQRQQEDLSPSGITTSQHQQQLQPTLPHHYSQHNNNNHPSPTHESNKIELIMHTSCYCILDLLCVMIVKPGVWIILVIKNIRPNICKKNIVPKID